MLPMVSQKLRNMFTTIVIDAFTAEGDPERYEKIYKEREMGTFSIARLSFITFHQYLLEYSTVLR